MNVSIAIATYNRADELQKTLAGLLQLDTAGCPEHEVLVVDNNSKDETAAVVNRMMPVFGGRLRYVREQKQGLSHARNRAIDDARYEIVAYLDDDVDTDPQWLKCLCAAYDSEDVAVVGGRAYLVYPGPKPRWLGESIEGLLTKVDLGPDRRTVDPSELCGVNLSFQKVWLERAGGFRTDMGRVGTTLLGGEDTDMGERIAAIGGSVMYEPNAIVGHRVPQSRLSRKWFWKRCFWGSLAAPRLWPDPRVTRYELLRRTWHTFRAACHACWSVRHGPRSARCFERQLDVASRLGLMLGLAGELCRRPRVSTPNTPEPAHECSPR
jgi:glycosyltransferase involved in cell wall biosynthesis